MTNHTENGQQSGTGNETIKPAEISLTRAQPPATGNPAPAVNLMRQVWAALVVLVLIAAAVIFVLPRYVQSPILTARTGTGPEAVVTPATTGPVAQTAGPAPWQTAQLAKQRERSQQVLSQMLELQEQLEQKNVRSWAGAEYERILQLAIDGDTAYQQQDFERSIALYDEAAAAMNTLLTNMEVLFTRAIEAGNAALAAGDSGGAEKSFQHALLIKPDAPAALTGIQRSKTLEQVLHLITEGNDLQLNGEFEQAKDRYEQALALDDRAETARQQLAEVNARIRDAEFTRLMSIGYARLQANELAGARTAFEQAGRLKPGAGEASTALTQIQARMTNDQITTILQSAVALEAAEKWKEATAEYDRALALDANLAQAQEGRQYAASRATLDERLEQFIGKPDRLSDPAVHADALALYQQAIAIEPAEPRLSTQLQTLDRLLAVAREPVPIRLLSDNLTDITVLRVGAQGKFSEKNLMLVPGTYTAVGTRAGYRDVRIEFRVSADTPAQIIQISATEKIAAR